MFEDHYQALWIPRDASDDEIKKAFRALARDCHPDLNPKDEAAKKKFQRIQRAFEILGDPAKREKYNRDYDAKFRKIPTPPPPSPPIHPPRETHDVDASTKPGSKVSPSARPRTGTTPTTAKKVDRMGRPTGSRDSPVSTVIKIVFGGIAGLVLGYLTIAMFFPQALWKEQAYRDTPSQQEPSLPYNRGPKSAKLVDIPKPKVLAPPRVEKLRTSEPIELTLPLAPREAIPRDQASGSGAMSGGGGIGGGGVPDAGLPDTGGFAGLGIGGGGIGGERLPGAGLPGGGGFGVRHEKSKKSLDDFVRTLEESPEPQERRDAISAIRRDRSNSIAALPALVQAISDVSAPVRLDALNAIADLEQDAASALPTLCKLSDNNEAVVRAAIVAMLRIDATSPDVKQVLSPLLKVTRKGSRNTEQILSRIWLCGQISQYGAKAKWAESHLRDNLDFAADALDESRAVDLFCACCKAISSLESPTPQAIAELNNYRKGKRLVTREQSRVDEAKLAADTAYRRLAPQGDK